MKVLVIGGRGSIGSRYVAILKHLGHEPLIYDLEEAAGKRFPPGYEKAIVAVPTYLHFYYADQLDCPSLIEKPLSKSLLECERLLGKDHLYVVNNWKFAAEDALETPPKKYIIRYDYYHTGSDGLAWDVCQLLYLGECTIKTDSPVFKCTINKAKITTENIQISYIKMIQAFISGEKEKLWNMKDGYFMSRAVYDYIARQTRTEAEDRVHEDLDRNAY